MGWRWGTRRVKRIGLRLDLCLLSAMEALDRKSDKAVFIENWAFVSPVVFAHYHA